MNKIIATILKNCPNDYFSSHEISILLGKDVSRNAQLNLISRLVKKGYIIRLKKGLFVLGEEYQRSPLNLFEISQFIYHPSYVGLHSALSFYGAIPEAVHSITCISINRDKEFKTPLGVFVYNRLNERIFREGIIRQETNKGAFLISTLEKTILDYLYIYKREWTGLSSLLSDLRFDEELIDMLNINEMERILEVYKSRNLLRFFRQFKKNVRKG